jgi:hypothetical protein
MSRPCKANRLSVLPGAAIFQATPRTPHLGLFALDVNAEPPAPLWRPRRNGERHQGEQRRARRHLSITSSAMASSVGGTSMPSALAFAAVSSLASGNVSRCRPKTFAISQPNLMVSAHTAVRSQSISTGLISRTARPGRGRPERRHAVSYERTFVQLPSDLGPAAARGGGWRALAASLSSRYSIGWLASLASSMPISMPREMP